MQNSAFPLWHILMGCFILRAGKQQTKMKHYSLFFEWIGGDIHHDAGRKYARRIPRASEWTSRKKIVDICKLQHISMDYIQLFVVFNSVLCSIQTDNVCIQISILYVKCPFQVNLIWNADIWFTSTINPFCFCWIVWKLFWSMKSANKIHLLRINFQIRFIFGIEVYKLSRNKKK